MYHPATAWGDHVPRCSGFSWTMTLVPGGASGVLLKSNAPYSWAYAERFGLRWEARSRLRVRSACGSKQSHSVRLKPGSVPQSVAMKWFLKVRMARSAAVDVGRAQLEVRVLRVEEVDQCPRRFIVEFLEAGSQAARLENVVGPPIC